MDIISIISKYGMVTNKFITSSKKISFLRPHISHKKERDTFFKYLQENCTTEQK